MFEVLLSHIKNKADITDEQKNLVQSFLTLKKLRRKQYLLQQRHICNVNIGSTFIFILLKPDIALRKYFIQNHLGRNLIIIFQI